MQHLIEKITSRLRIVANSAQAVSNVKPNSFTKAHQLQKTYEEIVQRTPNIQTHSDLIDFLNWVDMQTQEHKHQDPSGYVLASDITRRIIYS